MKLSIQKASKQRKFGRELNKLLHNQPEGNNSIATELHLKGKHGDGGAMDTSSKNAGIRPSSIDSVWEIVEQVGGKPYYWNRITNETSYDPPSSVALSPPPPPPPPPKYQLPGLLPPEPRSEILEDTAVCIAEENQTETAVSGYDVSYDVSNNATDEEAVAAASWTLVQEEDQAAYYWNTVTNETTFELPEGIVYTNYEGRMNTEEPPDATTYTTATAEEDPNSASEAEAPLWQEFTSPNGELMYMNLTNGNSQVEKPAGTTIIVSEEEGADGPVHWQECIYYDNEQDGEDGGGSYYYYYQNISTGENRTDRPVGLVMIAEIVE
jgi:hypothetical protein